jgi:predicted ATPase
MGRPRKEKLGEFGEVLEAILEEKDIEPGALAGASGLAPNIISDMMVNRNRRLTRPNVLTCIEGLTWLQAIDEYAANKLLRAASADRERGYKAPIKELDEYNERDKAVLDLLRAQKVSASVSHVVDAQRLAPIVGREEDKQAVLKYLSNRKNRLITLTGTAGVGKTRLALEVLKTIEKQNPEYVCIYISFAGLEENASILPTIAWELGIRIQGATDASAICEAIQRMEDKIPVLFLDNLEHVINYEPDEHQPNKDILSALLKGCPTLRIIATSRTPVVIDYEQVHPIKPLSVPRPYVTNPDQLSTYPSVMLFLSLVEARGIAVDIPKVVGLVATMCRKLEGLPLAIKIVAAHAAYDIADFYEHQWVDLLTLPNKYPDLTHHKTLEKTLLWSYNLLPPEHQVLFRYMGVFRSSFTHDALAAVRGQETTPSDVLAACGKKIAPQKLKELVRLLQDHGLVEGYSSNVTYSRIRPAPFRDHNGSFPTVIVQELPEITRSRLYLLQPIAEFAWSLLTPYETAFVQREHRRCYLNLVRDSERALRGAEQEIWYIRFEYEWKDIEYALEYTAAMFQHAHTGVKKEEGIALLECLTGLWWYWRLSRKITNVGWWWLRVTIPLLEMLAELKEHPLYYKALYMRAEAEAYYVRTRPLVISERIQMIEKMQNELEKCYQFFKERDVENAVCTLLLLVELLEEAIILGFSIYFFTDDTEDTRKAFFQQLFGYYRKFEDKDSSDYDPWFAAWVGMHLGGLLTALYNFGMAGHFYEESIRLYKEVHDRHGQEEVVVSLVQLTQMQLVATMPQEAWEQLSEEDFFACAKHIGRRTVDSTTGWHYYIYPPPASIYYPDVRRAGSYGGSRQLIQQADIEQIEDKLARVFQAYMVPYRYMSPKQLT